MKNIYVLEWRIVGKGKWERNCDFASSLAVARKEMDECVARDAKHFPETPTEYRIVKYARTK